MDNSRNFLLISLILRLRIEGASSASKLLRGGLRNALRRCLRKLLELLLRRGAAKLLRRCLLRELLELRLRKRLRCGLSVRSAVAASVGRTVGTRLSGRIPSVRGSTAAHSTHSAHRAHPSEAASSAAIATATAAHSAAAKLLTLLTLHIGAIRTRDIDGLSAAVVLHYDLELDRFALGERFESLRLNFGIMNEHVATAVFERDEAEALGGVELLARALTLLGRLRHLHRLSLRLTLIHRHRLHRLRHRLTHRLTHIHLRHLEVTSRDGEVEREREID